MKKIKKHIEITLEKMERSIVATPSEKYLQEFCDANHGQMDYLLMQMSKQYGYQLALQEILTFINDSDTSEN
jgi:hypothetical protein